MSKFTNEQMKKLAFRLMDLRDRIEKVTDLQERLINSEGWAIEYDKILIDIKKSAPEEKRQYLKDNYMILSFPFDMFSAALPKLEKVIRIPKQHLAQKILSESYKLLLDISNEFYSIQDKKFEALVNQAEADRRKAVADFKEQGKRIEDIENNRLK